jgi:hypothetical protein
MPPQAWHGYGFQELGAWESRLSRRCVRLRSESPAAQCVHRLERHARLAHGISALASARSICQGVRPPLTAITKRPRAATAERASGSDYLSGSAATSSADFQNFLVHRFKNEDYRLSKKRQRRLVDVVLFSLRQLRQTGTTGGCHFKTSGSRSLSQHGAQAHRLLGRHAHSAPCHPRQSSPGAIW